MTLFQFILICTGLLFVLFAIDLYQRQKFNLLHFLVFFWGTASVVVFTARPALLDKFWKFFGVASGSDVIVYSAIIFLVYMLLEVMNKLTRQDIERSDLIRAISVQQAWWSLGNAPIVFFIPAYNEDETALHTVEAVLDAGYAVVYVDDGSPKVSQIDALQKKFHGRALVTITHIMNLGQWAALQTAAHYTMRNHPHATFIVHFDADGQMQLSDVPVFLQKFEENPQLDIVLWSRNLGRAENMPLARKIMKAAARLFMRVVVGLHLTDTHNGFRVLRMRALPKIRITLNRMAHASEIEHLIAQNKLSYAEVPVHILYTEYSLWKWQKISGMRKVFKDFVWKVLFFK